MAASKPMNAIEKRLDVLVGLWNELAENPEARMLHWLVDQEEATTIDVCLEVQNEEGRDVPPLFIRFDGPFEDATTHRFSRHMDPLPNTFERGGSCSQRPTIVKR
jgi:hypothetical protein